MLNRCSKKGRVPKASKRSESSSERLGREKWLHEVMEEMEDSLKQNRQGEFFRKLRNLDASRAKPTSPSWMKVDNQSRVRRRNWRVGGDISK